jgi:2-C-methyl-D-erythritol 4-phosphate cytidylyltransferase
MSATTMQEDIDDVRGFIKGTVFKTRLELELAIEAAIAALPAPDEPWYGDAVAMIEEGKRQLKTCDRQMRQSMKHAAREEARLNSGLHTKTI